MTMPLEGIRVIDCTQVHLGPAATMMLGDLGAEVIKVEERIGGDITRGLHEIKGMSMDMPGGLNFYFESLNRNKESITLDLRKPQGREVLYRLIEKADVFVENFRVGVAERLQIDYETLAQYNSRLIYASCSPFGRRGPHSTSPAIDHTASARAGFLMAIASPEMSDEPPYSPPGALGDQISGVMLAYGIMTALVARERFNVGQRVDTSMLASLSWLQAQNIHSCLLLGQEWPNVPRGEVNAMTNYYRCADARWLSLALFQWDERHWTNLCKALGITEMEKDPRFDTWAKRISSKELLPVFDRVFATKTLAEWISVLEDYPDFIYEPVNTVSEVVTDPQMMENDYIVNVEHPVLGPIKMLGLPISLSRTPGAIRTTAPEFGQHTEKILLDICGYSWGKISELREEEVI